MYVIAYYLKSTLATGQIENLYHLSLISSQNSYLAKTFCSCFNSVENMTVPVKIENVAANKAAIENGK